jgi:hypothetical protein
MARHVPPPEADRPRQLRGDLRGQAAVLLIGDVVCLWSGHLFDGGRRQQLGEHPSGDLALWAVCQDQMRCLHTSPITECDRVHALVLISQIDISDGGTDLVDGPCIRRTVAKVVIEAGAVHAESEVVIRCG